MIRKSIQVFPSIRGWVVKKTGAARNSKIFDSKEKAVAFGIELSKKESSELYIQKGNGLIEKRNSYIKEFKTTLLEI